MIIFEKDIISSISKSNYQCFYETTDDKQINKLKKYDIPAYILFNTNPEFKKIWENQDYISFLYFLTITNKSFEYIKDKCVEYNKALSYCIRNIDLVKEKMKKKAN